MALHAPVALVTTVWLARDKALSPTCSTSSDRHVNVLSAFLLYHLEIGIAKIFVFFDGDEQSQVRLHELHAHVQECVVQGRIELHYTKRPNGDDSDSRIDDTVYAECALYEQSRDVLDEDVAARQMLNAERAIHACNAHNSHLGHGNAAVDSVGELRWLLHLDVDELLYVESFASKKTTPRTALSAYVHALETQHAHQLTIVNYEAIPTKIYGDNYFATTTTFRRHHARIPLTPMAHKALAFWQKRSPFQQYFLFYDNGKSLVRVAKDTIPASVHHWQLPGNMAPAATQKSNFFDARCNMLQSQVAIEPEGNRACVLHYPVCGLEWLEEKYTHLGRFPDVWGGKLQQGADLKIPPCFHTQARDARWPPEQSGGGGEAHAATLEDLYRGQVMLDMHAHKTEWQTQIDAGVCEEIRFPVELLRSYGLVQKEEGSKRHDASLSRDGPQKAPGTTSLKKETAATGATTGSPPAASSSAANSSFTVEKAWMLASITQQYL
ncbi:hypothetical protein FI667_g5875, partial [Globisporangium splendens]